MSKVFVIHQPVTRDRQTGRMRPYFDLSPALEYGEVINILPPGNIIQDYGQLAVEIKRRLLEENYGPKDYLLALGDPVAIVAGALAVAKLSHRAATLRLLKWDKRMNKYILCSIPI